MNAARILVVDDDRVLLKALKSKLGAEGYEVISVSNSTEAMHAVRESKPDLLLLDLTLFSEDGAFNGLTDGFSLLNWMRYSLQDAEFPVIVYTGNASREVERRASEYGVFAVLQKGCPPEVLVNTVSRALSCGPAQVKPASTF